MKTFLLTLILALTVGIGGTAVAQDRISRDQFFLVEEASQDIDSVIYELEAIKSKLNGIRAITATQPCCDNPNCQCQNCPGGDDCQCGVRRSAPPVRYEEAPVVRYEYVTQPVTVWQEPVYYTQPVVPQRSFFGLSMGCNGGSCGVGFGCTNGSCGW